MSAREVGLGHRAAVCHFSSTGVGRPGCAQLRECVDEWMWLVAGAGCARSKGASGRRRSSTPSPSPTSRRSPTLALRTLTPNPTTRHPPSENLGVAFVTLHTVEAAHLCIRACPDQCPQRRVLESELTAWASGLMWRVRRQGRIDRFCSEHKSEACVHLRSLRLRHADAPPSASSSAGANGASMQWEVAMQVGDHAVRTCAGVGIVLSG
eukprot:848698-Rhodomonas_salina.2